jgi:hypothetical protein
MLFHYFPTSKLSKKMKNFKKDKRKKVYYLSKLHLSGCQWLRTVIVATQEAAIRRIRV